MSSSPSLQTRAWMVSLHGGHSGDFCCHGQDTLPELLEAACDVGYAVFGVSNHAPPIDDRFLYDDEKAAGLDAAALNARFDQYFQTLNALVPQLAGRLTVLRGFEGEATPADGYADHIRALRGRHDFDYLVGAIHHVEDVPIDYDAATFARAVEKQGGEEALVVRYYQTVAELVEAVKPEIVGHLDLPRLLIKDKKNLTTPRVAAAAAEALDTIRSAGSILDVNASGYRKGLGGPYVAPWLVERAKDLGIPFCFGDDSHNVEQVGLNIARSRDYLIRLGVTMITTLEPGSAGPGRRDISL